MFHRGLNVLNKLNVCGTNRILSSRYSEVINDIENVIIIKGIIKDECDGCRVAVFREDLCLGVYMKAFSISMS